MFPAAGSKVQRERHATNFRETCRSMTAATELQVFVELVTHLPRCLFDLAAGDVADVLRGQVALEEIEGGGGGLRGGSDRRGGGRQDRDPEGNGHGGAGGFFLGRRRRTAVSLCWGV
ncbi:hypothetical protein DM860_004524 [Cuscuta australis]|uniref:Uncharacterized protein n=1 Tax=Cuscuta australis TaxID=267555 RepID=A0A328EBU0_9ASTE|nr:hypothetical protein DM860_004524 [Cuscuta australis]